MSRRQISDEAVRAGNIKVKPGKRFAEIEIGSASTGSEAERETQSTIEFTASSTAPVERYFWIEDEAGREVSGYLPEILLHGPENVSLRLDSVLLNHDANRVIGRVEEVRLEGGKSHVRASFDEDEESQRWAAKVQRGSVRGVSIGYTVNSYRFVYEGERYEGISGPAMIATDWSMHEVSITPIPADASVGVGRSTDTEAKLVPVVGADNPLPPKEGSDMSDATERTIEEGSPAEPTPNSQERDLVAERRDVRFLCELAGLSAERVLEFQERVDNGDSFEDIRSSIAEAKKSISTSGAISHGGAQIEADQADKFHRAAVLGVLVRGGLGSMLTDKEREAGREYASYGYQDLARESLTIHGQSTRGLVGSRVVERAMSVAPVEPGTYQGRAGYVHTTGTLANIALDAANKSMHIGYEEAPSTYQSWTRATSLTDFKSKNVVKVSELPELEKVGENGEITEAQLTDAKVAYSLNTYGKLVTVTRQMLINDDLGALTMTPFKLGSAARRTINRHVYDILVNGDSSAYTIDSVNLFASAHNNLLTTALDSANLTIARAAMRKQRGPNSDAYLNIAPRFLIVPPDLEHTALELIESSGSTVAEKSSGVTNVHRNSYELIVDAELVDADDWYLSADPSQIDTVEVAFLNGSDAPSIETFEGENTLGLKFRCFIDFGMAPIDFRGLHKNAYSPGG